MMRVVTVQGDARARGYAIGKHCGAAIGRLLELKRARGVGEREPWERRRGAIARHAPTCYEELSGMADATGMELVDLLVLSCEYEQWMDGATADKCTGFASVGALDASLVVGQTNDETVEDWADGRYDVVVRHRDPQQSRDTLIYTHPGIPAYMGINAHGVVCLWQYIDNGERDLDGVPTTALIRELLTYASVDEAVAYLQATPRAVPNNFLICGPKAPAINVECSPTRTTVTEIDTGFFCHTNHVLTDTVMQQDDLGAANPRSTTHARLDAMRRRLAECSHPLDLTTAQRLLCEPPIYYERTLAAMVFVPQDGQMSIHFKGDELGSYHHLETHRHDFSSRPS